MTTADYATLQQKYEDRLVKSDVYFIRTTGLLANQTLLKLGDYNLNGIPAVIGMKSLQLLLVLSPQEVGFFSRFVKGLHLLTMVFQRTPGKDPVRIPLRGVIEKLEPVLGRESLAMLTFHVKTPPGDFIEIIGNFIATLDYRKESWEGCKRVTIFVSQATAKAIGFNNFTELLGPGKPLRVRVKEFSADTAVLGKLDLENPSNFHQLKWYFRSGAIITDGTLDLQNPERPVFKMEFHPSIVDVIENYQFKLQLAQRSQRA